MEIFRKNKQLACIVLFFAILYSLISLVNHYCFRTYALDLGAYTNALYDYIHFQWNDSGVFKEIEENLLADHFDFYLIIFSPLTFIFGTATLLIVQISAVLFGGIGIYTYFKSLNKSNIIACAAALFFFSFFGVFSAIAFDYHSNVVAASLVPWLFYLINKKRLISSFLLLLLILVSKENISLWLVFICFGLAIEHRKNAYLRNYLIFSATFSGLYFITITSLVMPAFANSGNYPHFHYSYLGSNYSEALIQLISHPLDAITVLFTNHLDYPTGDYIKTELHLLLIISGLPFLLKKPQYLLMLVPIYFQKLFHDNYNMWGVGYQYSVEFAPVMAIGIFMVISEFKHIKHVKIASIVVVLLAVASTIRIMDYTVCFTDKSRIRFYSTSHYKKDYPIKLVYKQLELIPDDAVVSAQAPFLPHLALRNSIYQFPKIKDAEYLIYSLSESTYPLTIKEFNKLTYDLNNSGQWEIISNESVIILKKIISIE
jgi:uncharacterized membrane protein